MSKAQYETLVYDVNGDVKDNSTFFLTQNDAVVWGINQLLKRGNRFTVKVFRYNTRKAVEYIAAYAMSNNQIHIIY